MARKKLFMDGEIFAEYAEKIRKFGSLEYLKETTEEALVKSNEYVSELLHRDMKKHNQTGKTEASISDDSKVSWSGTIASIKAGFKISEGGLASIFLMYGTQVNGTPRTKPDQKLYNDVFGAASSKKRSEIQKEVLEKALRKAMEGK